MSTDLWLRAFHIFLSAEVSSLLDAREWQALAMAQECQEGVTMQSVLDQEQNPDNERTVSWTLFIWQEWVSRKLTATISVQWSNSRYDVFQQLSIYRTLCLREAVILPCTCVCLCTRTNNYTHFRNSKNLHLDLGIPWGPELQAISRSSLIIAFPEGHRIYILVPRTLLPEFALWPGSVRDIITSQMFKAFW